MADVVPTPPATPIADALQQKLDVLAEPVQGQRGHVTLAGALAGASKSASLEVGGSVRPGWQLAGFAALSWNGRDRDASAGVRSTWTW